MSKAGEDVFLNFVMPVPGFEPWFGGSTDPHPTGRFTLAQRTEIPYGRVDDGFYIVDAQERRFLHRIDGPAVVRTGESFVAERWRRVASHSVGSRPHRVDGPADVIRWSGDKPDEEKYSIGIAFESNSRTWEHRRDFFHDLLYVFSPADLLAEFATTPFAPLLDEGFRLTDLVDLLAAGIRTPGGIREVHDGAPVEWVLAFEVGGGS